MAPVSLASENSLNPQNPLLPVHPSSLLYPRKQTTVMGIYMYLAAGLLSNRNNADEVDFVFVFPNWIRRLQEEDKLW